MQNPVWKIITLGHLMPEKAPSDSPPACTSTLIESDNRKIIVDPGMSSVDDYRTALWKRSGYRPDDIDTVFLTHFHQNHWLSLRLFRKAVWMMSRVEIYRWEKREQTSDDEKDVLARVVPIEEHTLPGVEAVHTPGHTHGSTSLLFETREGIVVVAGDAVLSFDHFDNREPSEKTEDAVEARRSIDRIAKMADLVVPGHDNFFVV